MSLLAAAAVKSEATVRNKRSVPELEWMQIKKYSVCMTDLFGGNSSYKEEECRAAST